MRGFSFIPVVAESTGGWAKSSKRFLDAVAAQWASSKGIAVEEVKCKLFRQLSSVIQFGNIKCLTNHLLFEMEQ